MADPRHKEVKSEGGHVVRSATAPMNQVRSISVGHGFHKMKLHEAHIYPDPFPALPVVNRPAHTVELDNDNWEPAPVDYAMKKSPRLYKLMDVFPDISAAEQAKDWRCVRDSLARDLTVKCIWVQILGFGKTDAQKTHVCNQNGIRLWT